jgi:hypothetical protein
MKIIGGLGNQMFQYALGRNLSLKKETELKLECSYFTSERKGQTIRDYNLSAFNIIENFATKKEVAKYEKYKRKPGKKWFLYNKLIADKKKYFQERQFHFDEEAFEVSNDCCLDGFWQTEKYFKDIEDIIRSEFSLKRPLSHYSKGIEDAISNAKTPVSLHVRRDDLVNNPVMTDFHGFCSPEFYSSAIDIIAKKTISPHFFIFSDDYEWIVDHFKTLPFPYVCIKNGADKNHEDLYLMSKCHHHIISNSSFGWWGAWLNPNKNKIVIAPSRWFNHVKPNVNTKDILPEEWIRI